MKLTKTESLIHKNRKQTISLQVKFSLCSEISLCREIAIHSENFAIVAKFRNSSKKFAIVAKFRYNSEIALVAPACSCFLPDQLLHFCLDAIEDKSYELDVNQLNFVMLSLI